MAPARVTRAVKRPLSSVTVMVYSKYSDFVVFTHGPNTRTFQAQIRHAALGDGRVVAPFAADT